jgi:16S rRNA (guanine1207-N2)-methyltransferase
MDEHYFARAPRAKSRVGEVDLVLPDLHMRLRTDRGMFSPDRIDPGTRVLLENAPTPPQAGDLLDLGCGYGPVALTMAVRAPSARVLGVDVNERAIELARENAISAGLYNVKFSRMSQPTNSVPRFSAIWSNPPIRIGKRPLHMLLTGWLTHLSTEAAAYLVVQRHLGADSLQRWLAAQGWPAERLVSRSGYRVLEVRARG